MNPLAHEHETLTRRYFVAALGTGVAAWLTRGTAHAAETAAPAGAPLPAVEYLTVQEMFGTVERGTPLPYTLPPERLAAAGLTPETWRLDVISDPKYPAQLRQELRFHEGTAFRYADLLELGKTRSVRFLKDLMCANGAHPLGTGLWEGVPLRDVLARTGLVRNCRRIFYQGYHNADREQLFRSSLPADRVFEDPLETPPVVLAYRLNGEPISGKRGGPVRLVVPEAYGFKNMKWINLVVLSNRFTANDTYAEFNNTTESWMKTLARFGSMPQGIRAGMRIPLTGIAQVGTAGLTGVQVLVLPGDAKPSDEDPNYTRAPWRDATVLGPPTDWGARLPAEQAPGGSNGVAPAFGFSAATRSPKAWPMRFTTAHWATVLEPLPGGTHTVLCRSIDRDGNAQPLPRALQNSGRNKLHSMVLDVTA